jgi:hypothetical protein
MLKMSILLLSGTEAHRAYLEILGDLMMLLGFP